MYIWFVWPKTSYNGDVTDEVRPLTNQPNNYTGRKGYSASDLGNAESRNFSEEGSWFQPFVEPSLVPDHWPGSPQGSPLVTLATIVV